MRRPILLWSLALGAAVLWGVQRARTGRPQRGDSAGATPAASKTTADATGRGAGAKQQQPLNVSAVRAVPAPFTEHISATGTLRAEEGVELQAETGGRLRSINFTEGSRVKKGDLLIKLTDDDLQYVEGKKDEMIGRIQKRTGETREAVEKAVKESCSSCCS